MSLQRLRAWFARRPAPDAAVPPPPAPASPAPAAAGTDRLGPYRLERQIGDGAMGPVWLGRDPAGRPVALKTVLLGGGDDELDELEARERFSREAAIARRLQHPDIVAVLDAGETAGRAWIAMEYVPGQDLSHHTQPGRLLPLPVLLPLLGRAARALDHAHRLGVVHRDIKPANLLVDLQVGRIKIGDFGIARIADAARTRTGLVLGTPSFMAPEQMSGAPVDARSDVYALGVTAYQLLTGHLPFEAPTLGELMARIAQDPAPDPRRWQPDLPADLVAVVALALEKDPAARHPSAGAMAEALGAVTDRLEAEHERAASGAPCVNSVVQSPPAPPGGALDPGHNAPRMPPAPG